MRNFGKIAILACSFLVLGVLMLPNSASATCGEICKRVSINPFCRQCVPSSLPNAGCIQISECACIDENNCGVVKLSEPADVLLAAIFAPAGEQAPAAQTPVTAE